MSKQHGSASAWVLAVTFCFAPVWAEEQLASPQVAAAQPPSDQGAPQTPHKITPEEAKQLFSVVDELIQFSSSETGLPIKSTVKRQITSRETVESYLKKKFDEDLSARRLQQSEIVLKKFGLLDRDFSLKPFLLALLKEQIAAYYDPKTKTVYMMDWVNVEEQKPVLAHELTHALQDQHSDLEKWNNQTPDAVSINHADDTEHLAKDEMDTAREAVVEGQATAVMIDYVLKPMGKSLVKNPELMDFVQQRMEGAESSPVLARAPLLISESLLFPYREGLSFEQDVWMDQGQTAAFSGTLDRPPTSSWEIINPREYEKHHAPALPLLPNIHPLLDPLYKPYDIGQIGQLDLRILTRLFGGEQAASDLTPAWDGGMYWAGQLLSAKTQAEKARTDSLALFYLSAWKNAASAQAFAELYANELPRKYDRVKLESEDETVALPRPSSGYKIFPPPAASSGETSKTASSSDGQQQVYSTNEGPVLITVRGKRVFVTESFPLDLARKLTTLVLDAQGSGELKTAAAQPAGSTNKLSAQSSVFQPLEPLSGSFIRFFSDCGVIKAAIDAELKAATK
jgi:hypothetical protein